MVHIHSSRGPQWDLSWVSEGNVLCTHERVCSLSRGMQTALIYWPAPNRADGSTSVLICLLHMPLAYIQHKTTHFVFFQGSYTCVHAAFTCSPNYREKMSLRGKNSTWTPCDVAFPIWEIILTPEFPRWAGITHSTWRKEAGVAVAGNLYFISFCCKSFIGLFCR